MDRCSRCHLVQYRTALQRCRRCYLPLFVPAAAPPPVAAAVPDRPNVAIGVKCWRRLRGLTQKQLAVASQLPRTYISRIENGRITPGLVTLERVAGALSVTLPILLVPSSGAANSNTERSLNGSGNGAGIGYRNGPERLPGNGPRLSSASMEADACLREIQRYSSILSGAQRRQVLFRVRELVGARLALSH